jgi:hypothetical protein
MIVDENANYPQRSVELVLTTFYGQLTHIYRVHFPLPVPRLNIAEQKMHIFAAVRACNLKPADTQLHGLDIFGGCPTVVYKAISARRFTRIGIENTPYVEGWMSPGLWDPLIWIISYHSYCLDMDQYPIVSIVFTDTDLLLIVLIVLSISIVLQCI